MATKEKTTKKTAKKAVKASSTVAKKATSVSKKSPSVKKTAATKAKSTVSKKKSFATKSVAKKTVKTVKKTVTKKAEPAKKTPTTMADLLAQANYEVKPLNRGDVVEGTITEKSRHSLYIDIGAKTEGIVLDRDLADAKELLAELEVGDKIKAIVVQPENDSGQIVLSLKRAAMDRAWDFFEEKFETQEAFKVVGRETNKGGLIVRTRGIQGFVPASQFSADYVGKVDKLVEKKVAVKVIEVDREKNRLILSERAVSEAEMLAAQQKVLGEVKPGDEHEAEITAVMPFGFFAKIYFEKGNQKTFLEGLIHISEISWERVSEVGAYGKVGDKVKVKVLAIDDKSGKLNLSIKQLLPDPWDAVGDKYPKDKKVKGTVSRVTPFGVFVTLEPGIEGLVHISKIPATLSPKVGDELSCYVDSVDLEGRKMSLGVVLTEKPVGYK